jgi:hypothetical protein
MVVVNFDQLSRRRSAMLSNRSSSEGNSRDDTEWMKQSTLQVALKGIKQSRNGPLGYKFCLSTPASGDKYEI